MNNRKGQVAIFVIVAIVIVVAIVGFFLIRGSIQGTNIPGELQPVYSYYDGCIESEVAIALDIAGSQGGVIDTGDYIPGSEYAPFSNQLNFLGIPVPYWSYVSGNGLIKEELPGRSDIEKEIEEFIGRNLECDFSRFYEQGFEIDFEEPEVKVRISDTKVEVEVSSNLVVQKEELNARKGTHNVEVSSKFGKFYSLAREIYDEQKENAFLEEYGVDVLRLYAPVDGVEIQCSPKIWKTGEVVDELKSGLEANIASLKFKGSDYVLEDQKDEYFVVDKQVDENVNLIYSRSWPTKVEIEGEGVDDELMIAETVGNQEGLGVMGFCYAPYHFVYDLSYPVMIQIYNNEELFQFPVAVIIDNNLAREVEFTEEFDYLNEEGFDLCEVKDADVTINVYDVNLNEVDKARVSYECFTQRCNLGETVNGKFVGEAPRCVNGYLKVQAEGFAEKAQVFSTNEENTKDVILDREHEVDVVLKMGGVEVEDNALVIFTNEDGGSVSAVLPEVTKVKLREGQHTISVYVYADSSITMPSSTKQQCTDVPRSGIAGLFGSTKEECFTITLPETKIESALIGGGKQESYILESELQTERVILEVDNLGVPGSLEELQYNFEIFEAQQIEVRFE